LHAQKILAFFEEPALSLQLEQFIKLSKSSDWLEKATSFLDIKQANYYLF